MLGRNDQPTTHQINKPAREPCANPALALSPAGVNCELEVDECQSRPCQNGATCRDAPAAFSCSCPPGFLGALCQMDVDECLDESNCAGGSCENTFGSFRCLCPPPGRYDPQRRRCLPHGGEWQRPAGPT